MRISDWSSDVCSSDLSGINVKRTTVRIFVVMGVLSAIAAVVTTARLNAGTNSMGTLAELSVIAAAVIGGTSLAGGVGNVPGAILGAVIMQSLANGMVLIGVSSSMRNIDPQPPSELQSLMRLSYAVIFLKKNPPH